jgi:tRNA1(Val) A37 N6-methylase TrmN6
VKAVENVVNDLVGYKNLKIVQCSQYFNFSLDSVLLPNFVTIKSNVNKIIDFGCGNCPIPLILTTRTKAQIYGIEIQKEIFELAKETLKINDLESRITLINDDIKNVTNLFEAETFDIVVSNPPYFKVGSESKVNDNEIKTNARHETLITLEEIISKAKKLLKHDGIFALVHRTERLIEIIELLRKNNLEPKKIQFIFPKRDMESNLALIEARKNAKKGLKVLKPIIVHNKKGKYTKQILKYFE